MKEKTWFRRVYEFLIDNWFITAFISTSPTWWFTFVQIFGGNYGLVENGKLTPRALNILWPLFIISFLFNFLMALADKYNERVKKAGQNILSIMLDCVNAIKHTKLKRFINYINNHHNKHSLTPFFDITQPKDQIESILENTQIALSQLSDIGRDDISLSIIFETDKNPGWKWLSTINNETDLELQELLNNPDTTIRQIVDNKVDMLFFPDKRIGVLKNQYVPGRKDNSHGGKGSILCKDISLETKEMRIRAILSIATYGLQLTRTNDVDAINKITGIVLPSFERRIQLELSLLYIKEEMSLRISNKIKTKKMSSSTILKSKKTSSMNTSNNKRYPIKK